MQLRVVILKVLCVAVFGVAFVNCRETHQPNSASVSKNNEDLPSLNRHQPGRNVGVECYKEQDGSDYRGMVSTTSSGRTCQKWTSQSPHHHTKTPDRYPDAGLGDHNFCRNMDGAPRPWCYTIDPSVRWEYCDVGTPKKRCCYWRGGSGVVYTRWGHSSCPGFTKLVYKGIMAGSYFNNQGGRGSYLCMPEVAQYDNSAVHHGTQSDRGFFYPVEYRSSTGPLNSKRYHDLPCAVCLQEHRSSSIMYPARIDCPSGWTREYYGYLMSSKYNEASSDYACVDVSGGTLPGTSSKLNAAFLYPVETRCVAGSGLPCAPYVHGYELSCAVCSK